jgi:DNA-binding CsgD family transcriptional regulator
VEAASVRSEAEIWEDSVDRRLSSEEIARKYGLSENTVRVYLSRLAKKYGVKRPRGSVRREGMERRRMRSRKIATAVAHYRSRGKTFFEIGCILGLNEMRVQYFFRKHAPLEPELKCRTCNGDDLEISLKGDEVAVRCAACGAQRVL